ncbi:MAG: CPBP family intramembrane metalloprotease [Oscillibacter sp.]|nr:CPBP family intramembrane metalloprotease [Oscillibacter sp.]
MPGKMRTILWVSAVYAFSFICYVPMLLRQFGAMVPDALLYLRYFFVLIPALISAIFLTGEHTVKSCWLNCFKKISAKEIFVCIAAVLAGLLTSFGYSLWQKAELFRHAYPSPSAFVFSAAYLFATALMEEMAWRGFLLNRIAIGRGKVSAAGLTGVIWAVWHIPMWTVRNSLGLEEVIPLFIWAVLISLVLGITYFRFKNLLSVSLLHMIFNICFLAPAKYNNVVIFIGIIICYIFRKYKKGIKEF